MAASALAAPARFSFQRTIRSVLEAVCWFCIVCTPSTPVPISWYSCKVPWYPARYPLLNYSSTGRYCRAQCAAVALSKLTKTQTRATSPRTGMQLQLPMLETLSSARATHGIAARVLAAQHALVRELYPSSHVLHVQSSLSQTQPDHRTRRSIQQA